MKKSWTFKLTKNADPCEPMPQDTPQACGCINHMAGGITYCNRHKAVSELLERLQQAREDVLFRLDEMEEGHKQDHCDFAELVNQRKFFKDIDTTIARVSKK